MQYTYECICIFIYAESNLIHILSSVYVYLYIWLSTVNAIAAKEPNKRDLYKVPYKRDSLLHIQIRYTKITLTHYITYLEKEKEKRKAARRGDRHAGADMCVWGRTATPPSVTAATGVAVRLHAYVFVSACLSLCLLVCLFIHVNIYIYVL